MTGHSGTSEWPLEWGGTGAEGRGNFLWVKCIGAEGAKVINLRINAEGKFLDRWPEGFFEPRMDDVITGL